MSLIKTAEEIEYIRKGGVILGALLPELAKRAVPGATLKQLDDFAEEYIRSHGVTPGFKGYKPYGASEAYSATLCTSVNEIVVHGLPTSYALQDGDIVTIDVGAIVNGFYSDTAITVGVGSVSTQAQKLMDVTKEAVNRAIGVASAGNTLGDIGYAVVSYVRMNGFEVVKGLTGHGIGKDLHEEPSVFNEGSPGEGMKLEKGMTLAIEVMTSAGSPHIQQLPDDSYAISDNALSAHFEHTIAVTDGAAEILTN